MKPKHITYSDNWQKNYRYYRTEPVGKNFDPTFKPQLTPPEMLRLGIFGGAYFDGVDGLVPSDVPKAWFKGVALSPTGKKIPALNFFKLNASQPLKVWQQKGWIYKDDPHGWFQWYCRYYLGRRIPGEDDRQIKRWRAIKRHIMQVVRNCTPGDLYCRRKQRQAILHWAYDSRKM